ncbi:MAG: monooxygenase [Nocardioidaceae bacterium]|nr:monooxygenase [Nocardioidaceae bacterium]
MTVVQETSTLTDRCAVWLKDFEKAINTGDSALMRDLFIEESYWRDMVVFRWDVHQHHNLKAIEGALFPAVADRKPVNFEFDVNRPGPAISEASGVPMVEFFCTFDTEYGNAKGFFNLIPDEAAPYGMRARWFNTALYGLKGVDEDLAQERHPGLGYDDDRGPITWGDYRKNQLEYSDRDPEVLIVGGGHNGLGMAVRLKALGVDTLIVEKNARVGDNWRNRYDSLALHTPTDMSDLPYMPIPKAFPNYLPKDKLADYFESFASQMDLNCWTSTEFLGGEFDEESKTWTVTVRRNGEERTLHPTHVVFCVGQSAGRPNIPDLPGLDTFAGPVMHSTKFTSGKEHKGEKVLVVGVSTSAHDIAYDLYHNDAKVTMAQRSPTSIISIESANLAYGNYFIGTMPQDEVDQRFNASYIYPLLVEGLQGYTLMTNEMNKDLLINLEKVGMKLDVGPDETGWLMKFIRDGGGYYLNVGCSDVIVEGGIKIVQMDDFDHFVPEGVLMKDGTVVEYDTVVLATGFQKLEVQVADLLGDEVAAKVGKITGLGPDGEVRNFIMPTGQPHLWFQFGGIAEARKSTPYLAYQIKANLMGIAPTLVRQPDGSLKELGVRESVS